MKYIFICLFSLPLFLLGQQRQSQPVESTRMRMAELPASYSRVANDTIRPASFTQPCGSTVLAYSPTGAGAWGFVAGTNNFGDKEKAQRLEYSTTADIDILEIWAFFAIAKPVGDGTVKMKLYSTFSDGGPDALIGETGSSRVSGLGISDSAIVATIFPVIGNVSLSGESSFLASLDISGIYATNDTVSLFTTEEPCGDTTSSWELFSDDTWANMSSTVTWNLQIDLYLASVISFDETSSISDRLSLRGLAIGPAFPSPAQNALTIPITLDQPTEIDISVYDLNGRKIYSVQKGLLTSGEHDLDLEINTLSSGLYTFLIQTPQGALGSKFVVE